MSRLCVAVDARPLSGGQPGGFRTYVRALLRGMNDRHAAGEPVPRLLLYISHPLPPDVSATLPPGSETRLLPAHRLRADWLWNAQVRADAPDVVAGTQNYLPPGSPVPSAITLHDAIGIKRYAWDKETPRTLKERLINRYWHYQTGLSCRAARRVITVSHGSLGELRAALPDVPPARFVVVYNGVCLAPRFVGERDPRTLLALASPDPRKNLALLYTALSRHGERFGDAPRLRVACTTAIAASRTEVILARHGLTAECLTGLSDAALANEYARATVFVFPSHLEGFGMPPLEMMTTGGAVASSNAVCMPEVLGDAPVYFAPDDAGSLADAVRLLLDAPDERHDRGEQGRARAASFTCRRMADETIAVWEAAT